MLDRVRIVDMAKKRNRGGPVVAIAPSDGSGIDLSDRPGRAGEARFNWRWVVVVSGLSIGLLWLVSLL